MRNRNLYQDLKVTNPESKLITSRFPITYWHDDSTYRNTDYVVAMPFRGKDGQASLKDLIVLQEQLLKYAVFETAAIGSLICDPIGLDLLVNIAKMLVVVGKPDRGIDLDNLLNVGDYLQIGQIFLSENYSDENIIPADFQPGRIARIHKMDFMGKLIKYNNEKADGMVMDLIKPEPLPERPVVEERWAGDPSSIPIRPTAKPELINTPPLVPATVR